MQTPLVSIIVPVYNGAGTIEKCLRRIQHQTYSNIEVLVIDDGSTDETRTICQRFCRQDRRFRLLCQGHLGVAAGRNLAMKQARGQYL